MTDIKQALRQAQRAAEAGRLPEFDTVWAAAEMQARERRRPWAFAGLAAAVIAGIVWIAQPEERAWQYVDPDELASSTSWVAPSDVLLPERQFDIFKEIPVLIESTSTTEGALL
jgi:hypothetical protein